MVHAATPPTHAARRFMPEIQALRALAVALVVLFHLWPDSLTGGFVGVDVFFVISGYLISSHLLREADRTGSVRLIAFYAKRMRRLLPASLLVLAVSGVAAAVLLPPVFSVGAAREVVASSLYVQNLWLAGKAVTYSASDDVASPVQHYWSLSAEEQFYLVWPALVLLGLWAGRRWLRGRPVTGVAAVLVVVCLASFVHSVVFTHADPAAAYFVTTTRAWQFGVGALTGVLLRRWGPTTAGALALRWSGLALIVGTALTITQAMPFPGWLAVPPTLGTAAVILAGPTTPRDPSEFVTGLAPVQWLGDVSYAVYLWHWPLIVLLPYALHHPLTTPERVGILIATGVLAHLTRRFVEVPALSGSLSRRRPAATFAAAGLATGLIASSAFVFQALPAPAPDPALLGDQRCLGARAHALPTCPDPFATAPVAPVGPTDSPWITFPAAELWDGTRPARVLAMVGDSHAQTLMPALKPIAEANGYEFTFFLQGGCPATYADSPAFNGTPREPDECARATRELNGRIMAARPDVIVTSSFIGSAFRSEAESTAGFHAVWDEWSTFNPQIVVIADHPTTGGEYGAQCLALNLGDHLACAQPRSEALLPDPAAVAAASYRAPVTVVDLSDVFCDARQCHPVVGGLPVYWDGDHLTLTFATTLRPVIEARLHLRP